MVLVGDEYLDKLFVAHVDDLRHCGEAAPRSTFNRLRNTGNRGQIPARLLSKTIRLARVSR
jgi:hypothetical protein